MHTHLNMLTNMQSHTRVLTLMHTYIFTYTCILTHTYIHAYTHICLHMYAQAHITTMVSIFQTEGMFANSLVTACNSYLTGKESGLWR